MSESIASAKRRLVPEEIAAAYLELHPENRQMVADRITEILRWQQREDASAKLAKRGSKRRVSFRVSARGYSVLEKLADYAGSGGYHPGDVAAELFDWAFPALSTIEATEPLACTGYVSCVLYGTYGSGDEMLAGLLPLTDSRRLRLVPKTQAQAPPPRP